MSTLIKLLVVVLTFLLVLVTAYFMMTMPSTNLLSIQTAVWRFKYVGLALQVLLLIAAGCFWPSLVRWSIRRSLITPNEYERALAVKSKALWFTLFLICIEVGPSDLMLLLRSLAAQLP
jgi:hypothetical protein